MRAGQHHESHRVTHSNGALIRRCEHTHGQDDTNTATRDTTTMRDTPTTRDNRQHKTTNNTRQLTTQDNRQHKTTDNTRHNEPHTARFTHRRQRCVPRVHTQQRVNLVDIVNVIRNNIMNKYTVCYSLSAPMLHPNNPLRVIITPQNHKNCKNTVSNPHTAEPPPHRKTPHTVSNPHTAET
jgi:hypothetical protein